MAFVKAEYVARFEEAANSCINFAESRLEKSFPRSIMCNLGLKEQREQADKEGKIKFLCGRYLVRDEMENLPIKKAAIYTFCDGKTPTWINLYFVRADSEHSYIQILTSKKISANEIKHPEHPNTSIQFRIRLSDNGEI